MTTAHHASPFTTATAVSASCGGLPPLHEGTLLLEKAFGSELLTREERGALARKMYGTFSQRSSIYKEMGWVWYMSGAMQLTRYLVSFDYDTSKFTAYYAGDEAALRSVLEDVHEIISAPLPLK
jgi:hypothetical protein